MNVTEAIFHRRAVRAYTPRVVDEVTVRTLLRAAVQAPSAMNRQPWRFSVVQNVAQLARYSDRAKKMLMTPTANDAKVNRYVERLGDPSFNIFYDASTLIVIGVDERQPYADADCWLAAGNVMLAATEAGLGSCCIGFATSVLNTPDVMAELGLPAGGAAVAALIVGYPTAKPPPIPRAEPRISAWSR